MNELISKLTDNNYIRLGSKLGSPIVINCVPGAGKTTLIRELIKECSNFAAFSTVRADQENLIGRKIEKFTGEVPKDKLVILDEYQNLPTIPKGIFAVFGDPLQSCKPIPLEADFISFKSYRFGKSTEKLLKSLGFEVETDKEDTVSIEDIFEGEPTGQVVCFEKAVTALLRSHSVEFLEIKDLQGLTFKSVTFVTTGLVTEANKHFHLICLTRHCDSLKILSPGATYPNSE
uniref:Triple gene block protein 1 n=1 Tax=Cowpea mild mottle virus TaxID=67761 RepID=A0A8A5GR72_9VIRU|nr:triple gene block protein 1 [Cowpea mild mottle virus]